ncbi:inositol monophosphatase family protein [Bdellovibrionota bacterium FG-2]
MMKLAPKSLSHLKATTLNAAHAAGKVLEKYFTRPLEIREKPRAGLVTDADMGAEKAAMTILKKAYPSFGFLTEESHPEDITNPNVPGRWILDPLDGTTNFVHRFPMFCVSLALELEGEILMGVVYNPILKDTYFARKNAGATLNGKKIQVSKTRTLSASLLTTGFSTNQETETISNQLSVFRSLSLQTRGIRRPGSAAMDLAYTARGVFDGFWERKLSPWDVAAGFLLVEEAGGKVTDFNGRAFRINGGQITASNGKIHKALIKEMSEI